MQHIFFQCEVKAGTFKSMAVMIWRSAVYMLARMRMYMCACARAPYPKQHIPAPEPVTGAHNFESTKDRGIP